MAEQLNLTQKLAKIRNMSDVAVKDKKGFNYTYADITQMLANITAGMKKYNVSLIPSIEPGTAKIEKVVSTNTKVDKAGVSRDVTTTEMLFCAEMTFVWVNDEDKNDTLEVPWYVVGMQPDPSQAAGSGLTYCTRYFLMNFFQIAQADSDVDAYRSKQKAAAEAEDRAIVSAIIDEIDATVRKYLSEHQDEKDEVSKFIGRYAARGNYTLIKEPTLAAKLLSDFKAKYMQEA